ncbi:WD40 repeat-like protein [Annulohypoxylon moriforme]|nr:WD40 repeat-like protein [Annulohypoxylon moriforme]
MKPRDNQPDWLKGKFGSFNTFVKLKFKSKRNLDLVASSTENTTDTSRPSVSEPINQSEDLLTYQSRNGNDRPSHMPPVTSCAHIQDPIPEVDATTSDEIVCGPNGLPDPTYFWGEAYEKLDDNDKKWLNRHYRSLLTSDNSRQCDGSESQLGDEAYAKRIQVFAREKLEDSQKDSLGFHIGGKNVVVCDQLRKILHIIVSINDVVKAAVSSDPHAAIAWAGVMLVIPVLNQMMQQHHYAIQGFEEILDLLLRCRLVEERIFDIDGSSKSKLSEREYNLTLALRLKIIEFYFNVYLYQVRVLRHFKHHSPMRAIEDIVGWDDWKALTNKLKTLDIDIRNYQHMFFSGKADRNVEDLLSKTQELQKCIDARHEVDEQASHLRSLPVAHSAALNSLETENERRCTPGTRLEILNNLQRWIESPTGKPILWLYGMAGTGKSTIIRTVATALREEIPLVPDGTSLPDSIALGATFFFKRDDVRRNHASVLFTTLAHQLAHKYPCLERKIASAIKQHSSPSIGEQGLKIQWDELILKPLKTLRNELLPICLILIIDAFDECRDRETRATKMNTQQIIQCLGRLKELDNVRVRVLVTSRNESYIYHAFKDLPDNEYDEIELPKVSLDNLPDGKKDDITIFLEKELLENDLNKGDKSGKLQWPDADNFRKLVEMAGGLFIYAATACGFLEVEPDLAKRRLNMLLKGNSNEKSPSSILSQIYCAVLESYTQDWTDDEKQEDYPVKEILRVMVILLKPLPVRSLVEFTKSISLDDVQRNLSNLRSVVDLPKDPEIPASLVHLSFREFLLNKQRCERTGFLVEPSLVHFSLFKRCLEIMSRDLQMDMCNFQKPGVLSSEIPPGLVQGYISPHLRYACRYWINHFLQIKEGEQKQDLLADGGDVLQFLNEHVLHWLEALSLNGDIGSAVHLVDRLSSTINMRENLELSKLLYDLNRFILFSQYIIQEAPLQLYYSAILFTPTRSIIRSIFGKSLDKWVKKRPILNNSWSTELMCLDADSRRINSIAVSPDSKTIVASIQDGTIRFWETATGIETAKIPTPPLPTKIAYSADGQTVGVCYGRSTGIWLYDRGTSKTSEISASSMISDIAFSPCSDSKILASLSKDGIFSLWNISTQRRIRTHKVQSLYKEGIAFSPNGVLVAAYALGETPTIYIWDAETGHSKTSCQFQDQRLESIEFSPDGTVIALKNYGNLTTYDIETKDIIQDELIPENFVRYFLDWRAHKNMHLAVPRKVGNSPRNIDQLALFPNRKAMACVLSDKTIRICDITRSDDRDDRDDSDNTDPWEFSHITTSYCGDVLVFRTSGESGAISEFDIYQSEVWDTDKLEFQRELGTFGKGEIEFSPDKKFIVTYGWKQPTRVWNIATGEPLGKFENADRICFSPNGELSAVSSERTIRILETATWDEVKFKLENDGHISHMEFSNNNETFLWQTIGSSGYYLNLRKLEIGEKTYRIQCSSHDDPKPMFSPDSELVAFRSETQNCVCLSRVDKRIVVAKLPLSEDIYKFHMSFSPDSSRIVTAPQFEGTVTLWGTARGNPIDTFRMNSESVPIHGVMITLDGKLVIITNSCVVVWDPKVHRGSSRPLWFGYDLSLSKDNKYLVGPHGRLPLPSAPKDFDCLYVDNDWVLQGGERLLWLPPKYRTGFFNHKLVKGGTFILGLSSGSVACIKIDLGKSPLAQQPESYSQDENMLGAQVWSSWGSSD